MIHLYKNITDKGMDRIAEMLEKFISNPSSESFWIALVFVILYLAHNAKNIEDYLSHRPLKKYEKYINVTTDNALKKSLNKKLDQEILFRVTGIRQVNLAQKLIKLLGHTSLILTQGDLSFYCYHFYLNEHKVMLKPISIFKKAYGYFMRIYFLSLLGWALFQMFCFAVLLILTTFSTTRFDMDTLQTLATLLLGSLIMFVIAWSISPSIPRSNEKEMNELLEKFNHSENN